MDENNTQRSVVIVTERTALSDQIDSSVGPAIGCTRLRTVDAVPTKLESGPDLVMVDRRLGYEQAVQVLEMVRTAETAIRVGIVVENGAAENLIADGFDDVLEWPADRNAIRRTIDRLLSIREYDDRLDEYLSLLRERQAGGTDRRDRQARAIAIERRIDEIESHLDPLARNFDDRAVTVLFRDLDSPQPSVS